MRGTGYAEGAAALSPGVDAPPATVQLDTGSPALNPATLSWSQKQSAVRYNKRQGFTLAQIRGFQNAVRTADDGVFGPNTVSMIARYQAEHGLDVDGKIGPQTRAALQAAAGPVLRPADDEGAPETVPTVTSGQLSANFSLSEFASHDGAATPQSVIGNLQALARNLEALRTAAGNKSISVTSGYRSPAHNSAVGGARNSQHKYGRAADINVSGMSPRQVKQLIEQLITAGTMQQGGIGLYSGFVHYDTRGTRARW